MSRPAEDHRPSLPNDRSPLRSPIPGGNRAALALALGLVLLVLPLALLPLAPSGTTGAFGTSGALAPIPSPRTGAAVGAPVAPSVSSPSPARTDAASQPASLPSVSPPAPLLPVGWTTPRGPGTENGSSTGFAPEVDPLTGQPAFLANRSLGLPAGNLTGIAVVPGGPLVVALRNGTLWALGPRNLSPLWRAQVREPLAAGPTVLGNGSVGTVYAVGVSGRLYAWDAGTGAPDWNLSLGAPDLGAAPVAYQGSLFVLTAQNLTAVNATTGALLFTGKNFSADPTHTPSEANGLLYAQAVGGLDAFTEFGRLWNFTPWTGIHAGAPLWSDGLVAVAGPAGNLSGGLTGPHRWMDPLTPGKFPLLPAASSNGRIFATDGEGPLDAIAASPGSLLWRTPFYANGPPTVVGDQVYLGANVSGQGTGVAALNASSGQLDWFYPLSHAVNSTVAVADGVLYAIDRSGNATALGSPPLTVLGQVNRTAAEVGSPFSFSAAVTGGATSVASFQWTFSDGTTASGTPVSHSFPAVGASWAAVVATDSEGTVAQPYVLSVTVLPTLTAILHLDRSSGAVPLWVNATILPSGGAGIGSYVVGIQVTGASPGWYSPPSLTETLELSQAGTDYLTAWVNDSVGDVARSATLAVAVGPAAFPGPTLALASSSPSTLRVVWSSPPAPGFRAWVVNVSTDGGPNSTAATIAQANATSYFLSGLSMDSHLEVSVARLTTYGTFSSTMAYRVPLVAPSLGSASSGLPGQPLLTWTLPAAVDHFAGFTIEEGGPSGGTTTLTPSPGNGTAGETYQYLPPPLADLLTTTFTLTLATTDGVNSTSSPVDYTPTVAPPTLVVIPGPLVLHVSWDAVSFPDFSFVRVCFSNSTGPSALGSNALWTCPLVNATPLGSADLSVPTNGSYLVNVSAVANNGFVASGQPVPLQVPGASPGVVWYATPLFGVPFWFWVVLVFALLLLFFLGFELLREKREIPPYGGEVLPWDPLAPDLEPRARPKDAASLRVSPKLHRHRTSHPHRHPGGGGGSATDDDDEGEGEGQDDEAGGARATPVRLKRASGSPARSPKERAPPEDEAEGAGSDEDDGEGPTGSSSRTKGLSRAPSAPSRKPTPAGRPVKIDQVGDGTDADDEDEGEEDAPKRGNASAPEDDSIESELRKLPVVLRHREGSEEPAAPRERSTPSPPRPAAVRRPAPAEDDDDQGPEKATPPPRRPAPRPKPENEEPTL